MGCLRWIIVKNLIRLVYHEGSLILFIRGCDDGGLSVLGCCFSFIMLCSTLTSYD